MRRRLATLAAVSALALALSASPVLAGSPASSESVAGDVTCRTNIYTLSGTMSVILHGGTSDSGNAHGTAHYRMTDVTATLGSNSYRVVGVEVFGGTTNARTGGSQETWRFKVQIVGTGDSLNVVFRSSPSGDMNVFNVGTCSTQ